MRTVVEIVGEALGRGGVGREERIAADLVPVPARPVDLQLAHLHQRAANADAGRHLAGDRAGGDARRRLARRGAPAAAIVADAVFCVIDVVGVAGTVLVLDLAIVLRPLIDVVDEDRRSAFRSSPAGRSSSSIITPERMRASSGSRRWVVKRDVAGPAPVEIGLDVGRLERNSRRAAVDDAPDPRPVTFAEGGDAEEVPETVMGHGGPEAYIRESRRLRQTRRGPGRIRAQFPPRNIHCQFILTGALPRPATTKSSNDSHGDCKMLKTFAAIGISAAIAFAPLAALAQTDTTAPAAGAAPAATDAMAPAEEADEDPRSTWPRRRRSRPTRWRRPLRPPPNPQ